MNPIKQHLSAIVEKMIAELGVDGQSSYLLAVQGRYDTDPYYFLDWNLAVEDRLAPVRKISGWVRKNGGEPNGRFGTLAISKFTFNELAEAVENLL